jgi:hypothetical protein
LNRSPRWSKAACFSAPTTPNQLYALLSSRGLCV